MLKRAKPVALAIWGFLFYVFVVGTICSLLSYSYDDSVILIRPYLKPIRMLLTFYGGVFLFDIYVRRYGEKVIIPLILNILICISINNLIIIFQGIVPGFNEALQGLIHIHIPDTHYQVWERPGGLLYSGGAMASVIAGLALPLLAFLYFWSGINIFVTVFVFILTNIAIVMTGRTGLLFTAVFFVLIILFVMRKRKFWRSIFLITLLCITLIEGFGCLKQISDTSDVGLLKFNITRLERLVEPNSFEEGAAYKTIKNIIETVYLPDGSKQLLFGDINSIYNRRNPVSDMGYNRSICLYGLFGMILYYAIIVIVLKDSYRYRSLNKKGIFYLIFFISYLAIDFKESAIFSRGIFSIFILVAFCMYKEISEKLRSKNRIVAKEAKRKNELFKMHITR